MTRLAIIGGGAYAPRLCAALAQTFGGRAPLEITLIGRDPDRLAPIVAAARALLRLRGPNR